MIATEKIMVEMLNTKIKDIYNPGVILNEIRMALGIPDIVFMENCEPNADSIADYYAIKMISSLNNVDKIEVKELKRKANYPDNIFNKTLKLLVSKNYIEREKNIITIVKRYRFTKSSVNAVEVKLKDWKQGLFQANRYLFFADYSYLAMHNKFIKNVDLEEVKKLGLGLISIDDNSDLELVIEPKKSNQCDSLFKALFVEKIKERL